MTQVNLFIEKANPVAGDFVAGMQAAKGVGDERLYSLSNLSKGLVATNIPNTPAGNIIATNVQAAIDELDSDKQPNIGGALTVDTIDELTPAAGVTVEGVLLKDGDITPTTGIQLGGTGAANLLSDYEEGTWTPEYDTLTTPTSGVTYDIQQGTYVKIGKTVFLKGRLRTDAITTIGTGTLIIKGLPFVVESSTGFQLESAVISTLSGWDGTNVPHLVQVIASSSTLSVQYDKFGMAVLGSDLTNAANKNSLIFSFMYIT